MPHSCFLASVRVFYLSGAARREAPSSFHISCLEALWGLSSEPAVPLEILQVSLCPAPVWASAPPPPQMKKLLLFLPDLVPVLPLAPDGPAQVKKFIRFMP